MRNLLLSSLMLIFFLPPAQAQSCAGFLTELLAPSLSVESSQGKLALERLQEKIYSRYGQDKDVLQLAREITAIDPWSVSSATVIELSGVRLTVNKNIKGNLLTYLVPRIEIMEKDKALASGSRPQGLNPWFAKVALGLVLAMDEDAQANLQVDRILIEGTSVVNKDLISLLQNSGFKSRSFPLQKRPYDMDFGPRLSFRMDPSLEFMAETYAQPTVDEEMLRTWSLGINVVRF